MSELPANFDFHEYLNDGIKDEFSPIMEDIVQMKMRKRRTQNLNSIIEGSIQILHLALPLRQCIAN